MAVDNTLRYRGFNSYELEPGETLHSSLCDCEYLGFITTQWVALKVGGTIAAGSVRIVWIDDTGGQFGATELHTFTPTRLWERYTWTIAVPPEAVKLRVTFDGGEQGYHFACPMTEPGEIASAFDPSLASSVAWLTSTGAYVGLLSADQIIAGILRAVNGGAWFDLDKPEIVMKGEQADLSITPENPLKLTDKNGKFIGGLGLKNQLLGLVSGILTNDPEMKTYATIGYPEEGGSGIALYGEGEPTIYMGRYGATGDTWGVGINDIPRLRIGDDGTYVIFDQSGVMRLSISANGSSHIRDKNGVTRLWVDANGGTYIRDQNGATRLWIDANGDTYIRDKNGVDRLWIAANGNTFMQNAANSHAIGVDSGGPYRIKNGTKTYF